MKKAAGKGGISLAGAIAPGVGGMMGAPPEPAAGLTAIDFD